jgi:hypothetical protein
MNIFSALSAKNQVKLTRFHRESASHRQTGKNTFNPEKKNSVMGFSKLHDVTHNKGRFGAGGDSKRLRHGNSGTRCADTRHVAPSRRISGPYTSRRDQKDYWNDAASFKFGTLYQGHGIKKGRRKLRKLGIKPKVA